MARDEEPRQPPPAIERGDDDADSSTELPVVVLGDDSEATSEAPRVRLLQGRINERWILYPIYVLHLVAGGLAALFAAGSAEWSPIPVGLAWILLYVWNWFYGVAYRYRRPVLKYTSLFVIFGFTAALAFFVFERARAQTAMLDMHEIGERAAAPLLYWAGVATLVAAGLLLAHFVFLGRGYRRKRLASGD